jgi:hypothetical protein
MAKQQVKHVEQQVKQVKQVKSEETEKEWTGLFGAWPLTHPTQHQTQQPLPVTTPRAATARLATTSINIVTYTPSLHTHTQIATT